MQEKQEPVFVFATANNINQLPPELLRKGRFDELFFIDLPNPIEREEIFKIHIKKKKRDVENFDIQSLVDVSDKYTGAEIEIAIDEALYNAYYDKKREPKTEDVIQAIESIKPLATTMADQVDALREWAHGRTRVATSEYKESDEKKIAKSRNNQLDF